MKTLTFILLMFFCLNVSGQYIFTYTEILESVDNIDEFIEKLIMDKDFVVVRKYKKSNVVDHASFAKDYDKDKKMANIWVQIQRFVWDVKENEAVVIRIQFMDDPNYKYLVDKIKHYCKKTGFSYKETVKTYVSYYQHSDDTMFEFYKGNSLETPGNHIVIFNSGFGLFNLKKLKHHEKHEKVH